MKTASCSCGQLTATCEGEPHKIAACHCFECRRRTGSAFGIAVFFELPKVAIGGLSSIYSRSSDSGHRIEHHFCPQCGTTVFWFPVSKPNYVAVAGGCFVDGDLAAPAKSAFDARRYPWLSLVIAGSPSVEQSGPEVSE